MLCPTPESKPHTMLKDSEQLGGALANPVDTGSSGSVSGLRVSAVRDRVLHVFSFMSGVIRIVALLKVEPIDKKEPGCGH